MNVLVIDVGGTHVKILATGQKVHREFASGPTLTARQMVSRVQAPRRAAGNTTPCRSAIRARSCATGRSSEPHNLGRGWVGFDFAAAFGRPAKVVNDAAMQALGGYRGGKMLFLGLGTGLGSTLIVDGIVEPMELGHLPYRKGTFEDYVGDPRPGAAGARRSGGAQWSTWSSGSSPRSSRTRSCSAAAT